jgi:hypothetical protein
METKILKIFLLVFLLYSCSKSRENRNFPNKERSLQISDSFISNESETVTNKALNPLLCRDIDTVETIFDIVEIIDHNQAEYGGVEKKVRFSNGKWALFGSSHVNENLITTIVTNTNEVKVHETYQVGDKVSEILRSGDAFTFNEGEGGEYFYLVNENSRGYHLGFRVEEEYSSNFYNKVYSEGIEGATKNLNPDAKIIELTIQVICER